MNFFNKKSNTDNKARKAKKEKRAKAAEFKSLLNAEVSPISSELPYHAYDDETGVFINKFSTGFGLELSMFTGANGTLETSLLNLIESNIPDDCYGTFIRWCNNKVGDQLDINLNIGLKKGGLYEKVAVEADKYYRYAALESFPNKANVKASLRNNRLFLFLCFPYMSGKTIEAEIARVRHIKDELKASLTTVGLSNLDIDAVELINILKDVLKPNLDNLYYAKTRGIDELNPLSQQILDKSYELMVEKKHLNISFNKTESAKEIQTEIINFGFSQYPLNQEFHLWEVPDIFANLLRPSEAITASWVYTVSFHLLPLEAGKRMADKMFKSSETLAKSLGKIMPFYHKAYQEWDMLRRDIQDKKRRVLNLLPIFTIHTKAEHALKHIAEVQNSFNSHGFKVEPTLMQLPALLATMPFWVCEQRRMESSFKHMSFTVLAKSTNLVSLLPVVSDFKGSNGSGAILTSFRSQLSSLYFFSQQLGADNYNFCMSATPGSGKSVFAQEFILNILMRDGRIWVIDKGRSYEKLCKDLGGVYMDASSISLNPFTYIRDFNLSHNELRNKLEQKPEINNSDNIADELQGNFTVTRDLIAVMAGADNLSEVQLAHLQEAVIAAWRKKKNKAIIDDVIDALLEIYKAENDLRIKDIAILLRQFSSTGIYAQYFNKPSVLDPKANFVVLELGQFAQDPVLFKPILFAMLLNVQEQMFLTDRAIPKYCIFDEAWDVMSGTNSHAIRFLENGYRTARKHGGGFGVIVHSLKDFLKNKESEIIWETAGTKILLGQQDATALTVQFNNQDVLQPYEQMVAKTFQAAKVGFSSMLIRTGKTTSFNRFFIDPYKRILLSTEPNQVQMVDNLIAQGLPMRDAVGKVAEHYYGKELEMINRRLGHDA